MTDKGNVVPFGKYKGRLIEELLVDDPKYLEWLSGQPWFRDKFFMLHQVIINRGAEPEETPDHNSLQVLFLDDDFCLWFVRKYKDIDDLVYNKIRSRLNYEVERSKELLVLRQKEEKEKQDSIDYHEKKSEKASWEIASLNNDRKKLDEIKTDIAHLEDLIPNKCLIAEKWSKQSSSSDVAFRFDRYFEVRGIDVVLNGYARSEILDDGHLWQDQFLIEIKPTVSDDYPAVLRQMRANGSKVLFLEQYTGVGATREQFIRTFDTAGIKVIFRDDDAA
jgi:hypothetical protein